MGLISLIVLILLVVGAAPTWPYSRGWGYQPLGIIGFVLFVLLILLLVEAVPWGWGPRAVVVP